MSHHYKPLCKDNKITEDKMNKSGGNPKVKPLLIPNQWPPRSVQDKDTTQTPITNTTLTTAHGSTMTGTRRSTRSTLKTTTLNKDITEKSYYDTLAEMESEKQVASKMDTSCNMVKESDGMETRMYHATMEYTSFAFFQHTIIPILRAWTLMDVQKLHPDNKQWTEWLKVVDEHSTFQDVLTHTTVFDLLEYTNHINVCPAIKNNTLIKWDMDASAIRWGKLAANAPDNTTAPTMGPHWLQQ